MFPIPDALAAFYLICFAVGLLFVVASLFLGLTHDTLHTPGLDHGHADATHLGDMHHVGEAEASIDGDGEATANDGGAHVSVAHGHAAATHVSPINVSTIMAFLTWFGGAGYILRVYAGVLGIVSVAVATLVGLAGGAVIFFFLVRILLPGQRFLNPSDYQIVGTLATVTMHIEPGQIGEIIYTQGGSRHSDGARSADGKPIAHGTEVVIVRYERGIAYVEPWNSFIAKG